MARVGVTRERALTGLVALRPRVTRERDVLEDLAGARAEDRGELLEWRQRLFVDTRALER